MNLALANTKQIEKLSFVEWLKQAFRAGTRWEQCSKGGHSEQAGPGAWLRNTPTLPSPPLSPAFSISLHLHHLPPPPQTPAEHCTYYVPASIDHPRRVPSEADSPAARALGTGLGKGRPLCRTGDENWRGAGRSGMGGTLGQGLVGGA